jgi:hypothetical protein
MDIAETTEQTWASITFLDAIRDKKVHFYFSQRKSMDNPDSKDIRGDLNVS